MQKQPDQHRPDQQHLPSATPSSKTAPESDADHEATSSPSIRAVPSSSKMTAASAAPTSDPGILIDPDGRAGVDGGGDDDYERLANAGRTWFRASIEEDDDGTDDEVSLATHDDIARKQELLRKLGLPDPSRKQPPEKSAASPASPVPPDVTVSSDRAPHPSAIATSSKDVDIRQLRRASLPPLSIGSRSVKDSSENPASALSSSSPSSASSLKRTSFGGTSKRPKGGILSRLRRISRREQEASLSEAGAAPSSPNPPSPLVEEKEMAPEDGSDAEPTWPSAGNRVLQEGPGLPEPPLLFRDAQSQGMPYPGQFQRADSIRSAHASIVDGTSSYANSLLGSERDATPPETPGDDLTAEVGGPAPMAASGQGSAGALTPREGWRLRESRDYFSASGGTDPEGSTPKAEAGHFIKADRRRARAQEGSVPGAFVSAVEFDDEPEAPAVESAGDASDARSSGSVANALADADGTTENAETRDSGDTDDTEAFREALSRQSSYKLAPAIVPRRSQEAGTGLVEDVAPGAHVADTPRAGHAAARTDYFDSSSYVSDPEAGLSEEQRWLARAPLDAEQKHCLVYSMVASQLRWEIERAWLFDVSAEPGSLLPTKADDLGIFKSSPFEADLPQLAMPLLSFLLREAMATCPLLRVPLFHGSVETFVSDAMLPLAKLAQSLNLSAAVDCQGEDFGLPYNTATLGMVVRRLLFRACASFLTGVMRVASPAALEKDGISTAKENVDGKRAITWPTKRLPASFYFAHRKPVSVLKQGGMEIDVCGVRSTSGRECDFVLSVRRFGHPVHFVVRDESDLFEFARGLAAELGPVARVRPLPPPGELVIGPEDAGSLGYLSPMAAALGRTDSRQSLLSPINFPSALGLPKSQSSASLQTSRSKQGGSLRQAFMPPAAASRPAMARMNSDAAIDSASAVNASRLSVATGQQQAAVQGEAVRLSAHASSTTLNQESTTSGKNAETKPRRVATRLLRSHSPTRGTSSGSKVNAQESAPNSSGTSQTIPAYQELRRQQVRAWLRDAFACRGAGHSSEGKAFLSIATFSEKEMRSGTKADVELRARIDAEMLRERQALCESASDDIGELREELHALWHECTTGDGFLKMHEALRSSPSFSALPLTYQRAISAANLRIAELIHSIFVGGLAGASNVLQLQQLIASIPWRKISLALLEPTGLALQQLTKIVSNPAFIQRILGVFYDDTARAIQQGRPNGATEWAASAASMMERELVDLRRRFGSPVMRKLESFVDASDFKKRLIRRSAVTAGIPLVAAIARGSDAPRLTSQGISRVVAATKAYQEFMLTRPTASDVALKVRVNTDVRLIYDMQRALRLLSLRSDASKMRDATQDAVCVTLVCRLLDPMLAALKQVHDANAGHDVVDEVRQFLERLVDCLAGLRARVQEPWRSISSLASLLDDAVPTWYARLHALSQYRGSRKTTMLYDFFAWLHYLGRLVGQGTPKLDEFWVAPDAARPGKSGPAGSQEGASERAATEPALGADVAAHVERVATLERAKKLHELHVAARWAAGDVDASLPIQLVGEAGKTTTQPVPTEMPLEAPPTVALDALRAGFASACARVLAKRAETEES